MLLRVFAKILPSGYILICVSWVKPRNSSVFSKLQQVPITSGTYFKLKALEMISLKEPMQSSVIRNQFCSSKRPNTSVLTVLALVLFTLAILQHANEPY